MYYSIPFAKEQVGAKSGSHITETYHGSHLERSCSELEASIKNHGFYEPIPIYGCPVALCDFSQKKGITMEPKQERAAIYARCTSLSPGIDIDLAQQLTTCSAYCSQRAYSIDERYIYFDVGAGNPKHAPQLSRLRQAAAEGQIDVLVIASADRIDEFPAWQVIIIRELEQCHVRVESALERQGTHIVVEQIIKDTDLAVAQLLHMRERAASQQQRTLKRKKGNRKK